MQLFPLQHRQEPVRVQCCRVGGSQPACQMVSRRVERGASRLDIQVFAASRLPSSAVRMSSPIGASARVSLSYGRIMRRSARTYEPVNGSSKWSLMRAPNGRARKRGARWPPIWCCGSQYIPPMPPPGGATGAGLSSFFSTTTHSVVSRRPAIDAAFCSAVRVTLVGSMTPAFTRSS